VDQALVDLLVTTELQKDYNVQ